jgi:hypothetical protein
VITAREKWMQLAPHIPYRPTRICEIAKQAGVSRTWAIHAITYARAHGVVCETMMKDPTGRGRTVSLYSRL